MTWEALSSWAEYSALVLFAPPLVSALGVFLYPRMRAAMPGGTARMFRALCLQAYLLAISGVSVDFAFMFFAPRLYHFGGSGGLVGLVVTMLVWFLALLALMQFPPTSKLLRDVLKVQFRSPRATSPRKA